MEGRPNLPIRVLLVDDNEQLTSATERVFKRHGLLIESAWDGASALELLRRTDFDVIVSDVMMPGLDGVALLRAAREHDLDIPVILITGAPDVQAAARAVEYGAFRYLMKPVDLDDLRKLVEQAARVFQFAKLNRQVLEAHGRAAGQPADRSGLDASLDRAANSLWIAVQPVVQWPSRTVFAYEALVRSRETAFPNPGVLFEAAERAGRLADLSRAIRAATAAVVDRSPVRYTFVNLHPRDLLDDDLYDKGARLTALAPRIALEITERARLDEVSDLDARIRALRDLGFKIAVDDLGAGYSGLTSFARLEPDIAKIDMSLVRGVHREPMQAKLVSAIASLCRDTDKLVVAEGIETADERDTIARCGCDLLQGYLFAKPGVPFPDVSWGVGASLEARNG